MYYPRCRHCGSRLWDNDIDYIFCSLSIGKTLETGPSWTDTIQGADICGSSRLRGSMESALQHQIITLEDCGPVSVFVQVYEVANILSYIRVHTACGSGVGEYNQSLCYASHLWQFLKYQCNSDPHNTMQLQYHNTKHNSIKFMTIVTFLKSFCRETRRS